MSEKAPKNESLAAAAVRTRIAVVVALLLVALAACKPPESRSEATGVNDSGGVSIEMRVVGEVSIDGFIMDVAASRNGAPLQGAEATIVGEMTHPGMPRLTWPASEVEPGLYRAEEVQPDMPGDWIITAELVSQAGDKLTAELFLSVPR